MYLKKWGLPIAVSSTLLLIGCGGSSSSSNTKDATTLSGTWSDGLETKTFSGTDFTSSMSFDTPDMQYSVSGSGTLDINGTKLIQPNDINVTMFKWMYTSCTGTTTYKRQDLVDTANAYAYCGYNDWTINVQKDTSACACVDYKDIYAIDNTGLRFGDESGGDDADGFPEALSAEYFFRQ